MDLRYTPDEIAFRDELRAFFRREIPAEIRRKVSEGRKLSREDIVTSAAHPARARPGRAELAGRMGRQGLVAGAALHLHRGDAGRRRAAAARLQRQHGRPGHRHLRQSEAQKQRFLPPTANLDIWWAQGFSEPGAGRDLASLKTTARREGDEFIVNGQKTWTTLGQYADWIFCLVRTDPAAKKQQGISFLLIDMKTPGITLRPIITIDGGHEVNEVFFDDVRVPAENLVGELNKGWDYAKFLLSNERIGIARIGLTKERLARVKRLAQETPAGEGTVWDDPDFRRRLAWSEIELKALEITQMRVVAAQRTARGGQARPVELDPQDQGQRDPAAGDAVLVEVAGPYALPRPDREEEGLNLPSVGPTGRMPRRRCSSTTARSRSTAARTRSSATSSPKPSWA